MPSLKTPERLAGDDALARGAWIEAGDAFDADLRRHETPEALEGLGLAAWWLDLADRVFDSRERAYRLYLAADDPRGAARVAVWLGWDYWAFRGEPAVANGWLQRARRLLEDQPPCAERAWLDLREGSFAIPNARSAWPPTVSASRATSATSTTKCSDARSRVSRR
jgi:hypothetical protein